MTGSGESVLVIFRFAAAITVVPSVIVLLSVFGSVASDATLAVFEMVPEVMTFTVTVTLYESDAPATIVPKAQLGTPLGSPAHPDVETKVTPAGSVSVTTTL